MRHILTIKIPEDIYLRLEKWASQQGTTPAALATDLVSRRVVELEQDPLMRWAGALDSKVSDAAERHDDYLGHALAEELRGRPE
jgi:hypothetical protein